MEKKERKVLRHPFYDRFTIPGFIILVAGAFVVSELLIGGILGTAVAAFANGGKLDVTDPNMGIYSEVGVIVGAFVVLCIFWRWFYPEYEGSLKGGSRIWYWSGISLLLIAAISVTLLFDLSKLGCPPAVSIIGAFMAGIAEEAVFRGVGTGYLMRQWNEEKKLWPVIILSSFAFAIAHLPNMISGAPLVSTTMQMIHALSIGCILCAIFLRCGSLIPCMIMHIANDIVAFTDVSAMSENGLTYSSTQTVSAFDTISTIIIDAFLIGVAIWLTRPSMRAGIKETWDRKWKKEK